MKIIIDADACPKAVLKNAIEIAGQHRIQVITVANFNHNITSDLHIVVGDASQEADIKIINMTTPKDIVITQDWGLAAVVLSKKAAAISPAGIEYKQEKITFMLEEREIKAKIRRSGGHTKGPGKRTREEDIRFAETLERMIIREEHQNK